MHEKSTRREFLRMTTTAAGLALLPPGIRRAMAIEPDRRTGTIRDVEHIVILMQENRSFDHYLGTLRGVRGFSDPRPATMPDGRTVWHQPAAKVHGPHFKGRGLAAGVESVLPWYINPQRTTEHQAGTDHGWASGHGAWNHGHWNAWINQKQDVLTMGYLRREDVAYHHALADAFTICDAYHCSVHADTCPNRIMLWSGTLDPRNVLGRKPNGPGLDERHHVNGYTWTTYPERLEKAGISWQLYQGGSGEPGTPTDNYTDNSLEFFAAYQVKEGANPDGPLVQKGVTNRTLKQFREDAVSGRLAQVTWIVAPYIYSEHPEASPTDGASYIDKVLEALTANPSVWARTVVFINYDENDGLFDHVIPPMPPLTSGPGADGIVSPDLTDSLQDELLNLDLYPTEEHPLIPGHVARGMQPIGLGPRVPMLILSPWTRGGWVCSETFDHTSVLRFLEARFGIEEPNISAWRRSICGDLTSAFDFANPPQTEPVHFAVPKPLKTLNRPYQAPAEQQMPRQEPGTRPSRALPYVLMVNGEDSNGRFSIHFDNRGTAGVAFSVHDALRPQAPPRRYAVSAGSRITDLWEHAHGTVAYDLTVYGPHGYLRHFRGNAQPGLEAEATYEAGQEALLVRMKNIGDAPITVELAESYSGDRRSLALAPGTQQQQHWPLENSYGWYDLTVQDGDTSQQRFAGHVETGRPSTSDPATLSIS